MAAAEGYNLSMQTTNDIRAAFLDYFARNGHEVVPSSPLVPRNDPTLLFTNAGHQPPLWYRTATGEWSFLLDSTPYSKDIVDLPLGMIRGTAYSQTAVQLEMGDLLLLYTDGINESCDESGEQLGMEGLLSVARGLPVDSAAAAGHALLSAVNRFRGSAPPADDETVVALERRA